jgi:hypothetical protein
LNAAAAILALTMASASSAAEISSPANARGKTPTAYFPSVSYTMGVPNLPRAMV